MSVRIGGDYRCFRLDHWALFTSAPYAGHGTTSSSCVLPWRGETTGQICGTKRQLSCSKFPVGEWGEDEEEKERGPFLGRRKVGFGGDVPIRRFSVYPLVRQSGSNSFHTFTATLVDASNASKVAVIEGANCQTEIAILQNMGCYGYAPEFEAGRQGCGRPSRLFLFDTEMFFLLHGLGVLRVRIPQEISEGAAFVEAGEEKSNKTPTHHLWYLLSSPNKPGSEPALTPFHLRYAAYLHYRSRGWIVRPALTLGGVDFLLYAESPCLRHAAYAVIVVPASVTRSARDVAAHLRVASSVAKRLIIAEVGILAEGECKGEPWERVKDYTIEETLLSRATDIV
ncbi:tRNA-splicing endonuclease subunit Sen2-1 [Taenia crassiceps]|uniref:tRNA-intron lyase n=1 Tax=Taenia crassiceps TaxID=6207 RepID=A0ABR4Q195_9CEST